ncbi:hypothetical protein Y032_0084g1764 [Ancylostoma ceylanicum]|nr:hypothetical protein Y032_0084g1764 [Ancylostoma ceylanicum]
MDAVTRDLNDRLAQFDLRLNVTETEYLTTYVNQIGTISVGALIFRELEPIKTLDQRSRSTVAFLTKSLHALMQRGAH